jgi:histidinol-phosphate aminotransferase
MRIPAGLDILLGNGSDEIIQLIALATAKPGARLLSVEPAFVMFKIIATFCGQSYIGVPLRADFSLDQPALLAAIQREQPAVTFLAYPNNPSGNLFDRTAIRAIIALAGQYGGLVVIDEAYFAFSRESFLDEIAEHSNAVLMRTVSKLGLAGIRLGMLIGRAEWLSEFDKLRLPYNINALTQAAAGFAMRHYGALLQQAEVIKVERARMAAALDRIDGVVRFSSEANFILIRVPDAGQTFERLLSRKILVKNTSKSHLLLTNTLRLTVGTPAENDALIAALQYLI